MSSGYKSWYPTNNGSGRAYVREWQGNNGRFSENAYDMFGYWDERFPFLTRYPDGAIAREGADGIGFKGLSNIGLRVGLDNNTANKALTKLVDKMRGHQFNAGIAVATSRQTADTLVGLVGSLCQGIRSLKRGNVDEAVRHFTRTLHASSKTLQRRKQKVLSSEDVTSLWLSTQYAWGPLLNDIYESAKFIEKRYSPTGQAPPVTFRVRAQGPDTILDHALEGQDRVGLSPFTHSVKVEYRVTVLENRSSLADELGITNPALVAWDLFLWSFVIDWAWPIGTYLDNRGYLGNFSMQVHRTIYEVATADIRNWKCQNPWIGSYHHPHRMECCGQTPIEVWSDIARGGHIVRAVWVDREVNIPLVVPPPTLKRMEQILSTGHLLNAGALIHGLLNGAKHN